MHPSNLQKLEESIEKQREREKEVISGKLLTDQPVIELKPEKTATELAVLAPIERWGTVTAPVTQRTMDKSLIDFVVEEMHPLSVVDKPTFIIVARLGCLKSYSVVSSRKLKSIIFNACNEMKENRSKN